MRIIESVDSERNKILIILIIGLFAGYALYYNNISDNLVTKSKTYTIATVEKIEAGGRGCGQKVSVSFKYKNLEHRQTYCESIADVTASFRGRRFFIKIIPNHLNKGFDVCFNFGVPDSIKSAPYAGWDESWMNQNFLGCVK